MQRPSRCSTEPGPPQTRPPFRPAEAVADARPIGYITRNAPVAQLDRALPSEGKGHTFESCRVRQFFFLYNAVCRPSLRLQTFFNRASKQLGENRWLMQIAWQLIGRRKLAMLR